MPERAGRWLRRSSAPLLVAALAAAAGPACAQRPGAATSAGTVAAVPPAPAMPSGLDALVVQAREALRRKDRPTMLAAARALAAAEHPLAPWAEYWELSSRLPEAQPAELAAFFARWSGTYVEDRLRNDWLLELGRRQDWTAFRAELPRFRMADDREVDCYALAARHAEGQDVRGPAREALGAALRDFDEGCALLAQTLAGAGLLTADDLWPLLYRAADSGRLRAARTLAPLAHPSLERRLTEVWEQPQRHFSGRPQAAVRAPHEVDVLALIRLATADPDAAAQQLDGGSASAGLPTLLSAVAWGYVARQAGFKQSPQAAAYARRAWALWDRHARGAAVPWPDDVLAWHVRAALREGAQGEMAGAAQQAARWRLVQRAIDAMGPAPSAERREGTWTYWGARARLALARPGAEGDAQRAAARQALESIASPLGFYGQLAAADLGWQTALPAPPPPLTTAARAAARRDPGLARALQLIALGLRNEGVREWNWTLRGLGDRELLAAAQLACEREVWDRCINTSERAQGEIDIGQRFPMPWREAIVARARAEGLDPALVFGLIRQESRFIVDTRSSVGASGLMQLMPATARWTARRAGVELAPERLNDPALNLQLGSVYLRQVLDDFGGSAPLATAAYNAGPGRARRWREGPVLDSAAWVESIPFNETRDYVKKVLSNAVVYGALLAPPAGAAAGTAVAAPPPALPARLGATIGPRDPNAPQPDRELP